MKNTRSRAIQEAIISYDTDRIDLAISDLQASGDVEAWEELLRDTIIDHRGRLHASAAMILPAPRQWMSDYALLELIGRAPEGLNLNPTLQKKHVKSLQFRNIDRESGSAPVQRPFPRGIYQLYALEDIDIHGVQTGDLPDGISGLAALRRLRLANTGICRLPNDISGCHRLEWLDLSLNSLQDLPANLTSIHSLRELHLDGNNLGSLPDALQTLSLLQVIRLPENIFREIPEILTRMPSLKKIIISYNKLTGDIPAGMADLPELELLDLTGNGGLKKNAGTAIIMSGPSVKTDPAIVTDTAALPDAGGLRVMEDPSIEQPADEAPGERIRSWAENIDGYLFSKENRQGRAGIELIRTINDPELFRYLLRHWSIRDGELVCDAPEEAQKAGAYIRYSEHVTDLLFHNDSDYLKTAFDLSRITKLGLGFKSMRFPGITQMMPNIEVLQISLLDQYVPEFMTSFRQIRKLRVLGTDNITTFDLDGWPLLQEIDYMGGSCQQFSIRNCPALTMLRVRGSDYPEILLSNNPRLEKVSLTPERMDTLKIEACSGISSLTLGGRGDVKRFQLGDMPQLAALSIDRPVNMELVARLLEAPCLRDIKLGASRNWVPLVCQIETLPPPASPWIRSFSLKEIGLSVIPDWLLALDKLEVLDLSDNLIEYLPSDWTGLRSLKQLMLDRNRITALPEGMRLPASLRELHLGNNRLHSIPATLADLPVLEYLQLDTQTASEAKDSTLRSVPPALSGKPGLKIRINMNEMDKRKMMAEGLAWQIRTYGQLMWREA